MKFLKTAVFLLTAYSVELTAYGQSDGTLNGYKMRPEGATVTRNIETIAGESKTVRDFGAVRNGTTNDASAFSSMASAVGVGGVIDAPGGLYRISSGFTVPEAAMLRGSGAVIDRVGLKVDTTLAGPAVTLSNGASVQDLAVFYDDLTRDTDTTRVGVFIPYKTGSLLNRWASLRNVFTFGASIGLKAENYFHGITDLKAHHHNIGIQVRGRSTGGAITGSTEFSKMHVRDCSIAGLDVKGQVNPFTVAQSTFEFNRVHVRNDGGLLTLRDLYLGDDPEKAIHNVSGTLTVFSSLSQPIHGGSWKFAGAESLVRSTAWDAGAVHAEGGVVELHDARLDNCIGLGAGYTNRPGLGQGEDRGYAIRVDSLATVRCFNVYSNTLFPVKGKGKLEGDRITNYVLGGAFNDLDRLGHAFQTTVTTNSWDVTPWGGRVGKLTGHGGVYFEVPPSKIGSVMYLVIRSHRDTDWTIGFPGQPFPGPDSKGWATVPRSGPTVTLWPALSQVGIQSDGYVIPQPAYHDQPRVDYIPIRITASRGIINVSGLPKLSLLCLVDASDFGRIGLYTDYSPSYLTTGTPTAGTWQVGDIVREFEPVSGGASFRQCTTAGSPGTWKAVSLP